MQEVFEADDPSGAHENQEILSDILNDVRLPSFKAREYPMLDDEDPFGSPRIKDEVWT